MLEQKDFQNAIDHGLADVTLSPERQRQILAVAEKQTAPKKPVRRAALAACLLILLLFCTIFVPPIRAALDSAFAFLGPTQETAESGDVTITITDALYDAGSLSIYLTMHTEESSHLPGFPLQARLLPDGIDVPCEQTEYDPVRRTARYRLVCTDPAVLNGAKRTLSFSAQEGGGTLSFDTGYSLDQLLRDGAQPKTQSLEGQGPALHLTPGANPLPLLGEGRPSISNFGVLQGRLQILVSQNSDQTAQNDLLNFYFAGRLGGAVRSESQALRTKKESIRFPEKDTRGNTLLVPYQEFSLDLPKETAQVHLWCAFQTAPEAINETWELTFRASPVTGTKEIPFQKEMLGGWSVTSVSLSPVGVTLYTTGDFLSSRKNSGTPLGGLVAVTWKDGATDTLPLSLEELSANRLKYRFPSPLDIREIRSISVEGTEIPVE